MNIPIGQTGLERIIAEVNQEIFNLRAIFFSNYLSSLTDTATDLNLQVGYKEWIDLYSELLERFCPQHKVYALEEMAKITDRQVIVSKGTHKPTIRRPLANIERAAIYAYTCLNLLVSQRTREIGMDEEHIKVTKTDISYHSEEAYSQAKFLFKMKVQ